MKWFFYLVLALGSAAAAAPSPDEVIAGRAEVVKVEKKAWAIMVHDPEQRVAEGDYFITLRITEPKAYRASVRLFGVYAETELKIGGHPLAPGDTLSFRAARRVFTGSIEPDVLANLREIAVVAKAAPAAEAPKRAP